MMIHEMMAVMMMTVMMLIADLYLKEIDSMLIEQYWQTKLAKDLEFV